MPKLKNSNETFCVILGHTYKSELTQYLPIKVCNISTMSINASISRKGDMPLAVSIAIARQNKGGKYHLC